jgi:erythritol kinase (D-erythritol 1-phosphate-forming)
MASICLDVGTSLIKAVAFDEDGNELSVVRQPTEVLRPQPGFAEQDMGAVWDAVSGAVKEMTGSLEEKVELLAFTGQGDGCWLVDADGRPTGPAVLWNDARNAALVQKWERDGTLARAFEINGSLAFPGLPCAVLPWLREHEPERVENAYRSMFCDGWIFLRLTGEFGIDESDASVPLLDIRTGEYSDELLAMYELEWARELLPDIRRQGSRMGELGAEAAEAMGLAPGLPVVMAPFDIAATSIGCGSVDTGQACSILGTTLCTEIVTDEVDTGGSAAGFTISMGVPNHFLRAFAAMAGTDVIDWAVATLGVSDAPELGRLAEEAQPGAGGLSVLPYFSPAGERAPFLDPGARGTAFGLTVEHGRADIARAVFEGLTLVVRDCLAAASTESTELRLCGGGSASDFWCQLIADATGLVTRRSADSELGAKGALITALVETGGESDFTEAASRLAKMGDEFSPDDQAHEAMSERYERFLEMREVAERSWRVLEGGGPES